ncbi:hypothetical protein K3495_g12283 [Podosphaera aphanis]|nr:hypothetical protein K3495_g12283 [Podosphaera aphanis]
MKLKFNALLSKKIVELVQQNNSMHPIPLKWIFAHKLDEAGYLLNLRPEFVFGVIYNLKRKENYAKTLAYQDFRLLTAMAAAFDLEIIQADAVNAFCNSPLDDEIYLFNPPGFNHKGKILQLSRGL